MRRIQDFSGFFDDTTIVLCGDAIIDLDLHAAVFEHRSKKAMASVVTLEVPKDEVKNYGIVVAGKDNRVTSFQEKPSPEEARSRLASTGIYIFEPEVIELIPKDREFDIGSQLFPMLVEQGLPFFAQSRYFNWIDIGRVSDYWSVCQRVLRGEIAQMDMPAGHRQRRLHRHARRERLLARGDEVVGLDNLNDYYDPALKRARLARLLEHEAYTHVQADLADRGGDGGAVRGATPQRVVHLAAQAGVRYSLENPHAYVAATSPASCNVLEAAGTTVSSTSCSPRPARCTAPTRACRSPSTRQRRPSRSRCTPRPRRPTS
jgi:hypothetical protein